VGLVHISEIDERYVRDVADYLEAEDRVVVKIIAHKESGKYEFSIKQAKGADAKELEEDLCPDDFDAYEPADDFSRREARIAFDEKLREFMTASSERLSDLRRHNDTKLGSRHKR
jgi:S1 RNA binding domain protein